LMKADLGEAGQNLLIPRWQQQLVHGRKTGGKSAAIVRQKDGTAVKKSRAYRADLDSKWFPTVKVAEFFEPKSCGVAVFEHRYDVVLDASTSIIMIEMPFLRLRAEMGKLRTAMEKASKEYDQEKELYAGLEEELSRFETMLSSTVELFTVKDERKARTLAEWLGGLLGLYNRVKVKLIEHKEDSTRDALKTALVHLNAMDLHEKEEETSIGQVID
jgi:hypothetical protein